MAEHDTQGMENRAGSGKTTSKEFNADALIGRVGKMKLAELRENKAALDAIVDAYQQAHRESTSGGVITDEERNSTEYRQYAQALRVLDAIDPKFAELQARADALRQQISAIDATINGSASDQNSEGYSPTHVALQRTERDKLAKDLQNIEGKTQVERENTEKRGIGSALAGLRDRVTNAFRKGGAVHRVIDVVDNALPFGGIRGLVNRFRGNREQSSSTTEQQVAAPAAPEGAPNNPDEEKGPNLLDKSKEWLKGLLNKDIPANEIVDAIKEEYAEIQDVLSAERDRLEADIADRKELITELEATLDVLDKNDAETQQLLADLIQHNQDVLALAEAKLKDVKRQKNVVRSMPGRAQIALNRYEKYKESGNEEGAERQHAILRELLSQLNGYDSREAETSWFGARKADMLRGIQSLYGELGKIDVKALLERINKDPELRDALLASGAQIASALLLPGATIASAVYAPIKIVNEERSIRRADDNNAVEAGLRRKYDRLTNRFGEPNEEDTGKFRWLKALGKAGLNIWTSFENALAKVRVAPDRKRGQVSGAVSEMRTIGVEDGAQVEGVPTPEQIQTWLENLVKSDDPREMLNGLNAVDQLLTNLTDLDLFDHKFSPTMLESVFGERTRSILGKIPLVPDHTYDHELVQREFLQNLLAQVKHFSADFARSEKVLRAVEKTGGFTGNRLGNRLKSLLERSGEGYRLKRAKDMWRGLYRGEIYATVGKGFLLDLLLGRIQSATSGGVEVSEAGTSVAETSDSGVPEIVEAPTDGTNVVVDGGTPNITIDAGDLGDGIIASSDSGEVSSAVAEVVAGADASSAVETVNSANIMSIPGVDTNAEINLFADLFGSNPDLNGVLTMSEAQEILAVYNDLAERGVTTYADVLRIVDNDPTAIEAVVFRLAQGINDFGTGDFYPGTVADAASVTRWLEQQ